MENASKALIIAGAILLSILIISLGIMIFGQASGVVNNNAMNEVEISSFNQKFMQFEGTNVKGAQVNSLISTIVQNNIANQDDTSKQVEIDVSSSNWQTTGTKPSGKATSIGAKAQTGKTYKVVCDTDSKSGMVNKVTISDPGATSSGGSSTTTGE